MNFLKIVIVYLQIYKVINENEYYSSNIRSSSNAEDLLAAIFS